jgi:bla regulator protein blaR1
MILPALLNGLWQGALIVAIAYLVVRLISERNAATKYAVWYAALLALVLVPILTTVSNAGSLLLEIFRAHLPGTSFTISLLPAGSFVRHTGVWFEASGAWILAAWLIGVGVNLVRLGGSFVRVHRIRRGATRLAGADPDVFVSECVVVPIVAGILQPVIVIPKSLPSELTAMDLKRIILHERAHIYRNDPLLNFIQRLIEAWLFFNPWVQFAGRQLSREREAACDDWVVEKVGSPDEYAACLAALAQNARAGHAPLLTPSAFGSRHALVSRIERLSSNEPPRLSVNFFALGGTIVIFIVTTLALQALSPAQALLPAAQSVTQGAPAVASAVAAACANPNADASVVTAAEPAFPQGLKLRGTADVLVTIAPSGRVIHTTVLHSTGDSTLDNAVVVAARQSTYSPKQVSCNPVQGRYIFHVEFKPQ